MMFLMPDWLKTSIRRIISDHKRISLPAQRERNVNFPLAS
jgi:hypothetical protein